MSAYKGVSRVDTLPRKASNVASLHSDNAPVRFKKTSLDLLHTLFEFKRSLVNRFIPIDTNLKTPSSDTSICNISHNSLFTEKTMNHSGTRNLWGITAAAFLLTACISTPKKVTFEHLQQPDTQIPGYVANISQLPSSDLAVYLPETQYAKTPSKLVLMISNNGSKSFLFDPTKDLKIESKIDLQKLYGNSAEKVLKQFSSSAFGKDCKVDPARTMAGFIPPAGWNSALKATEVAPGQVVTGYLLLDPQQLQMSDMQIQVQLGQQQHQIKINLN
ncbi:hypothetical protein [Pelagibaculum spongiae]|uniref:Uncharacterized protein n=1 Tax=Pelagibaculum spongiae TaxID=2080658 RepID=A0A2V1H5Y7_9GAMM|nr:hypothetical protein [Pelagibaculum spongiae]PVZ71842.1 hypothetical protein DC094_02110 [Pelagibaculum spongiae]